MGAKSRGSRQDDKLKILCAEIAPLLSRGEYSPALAYAVLSCVYLDGALYTRALHAAKFAPVSIEASSENLIAMFPIDSSVDAASLEQELRKSPLSVLLWLDHMLTTSQPIESAGYASYVYLGDVIVVEIDEATRGRLALPDDLERAYLCRNIGIHWPPSPVEQKKLSPNAFTPHWHVVAERPDLRQPSRMVEVHVPNATFQQACTALAKKRIINLYLAEFNATPDFDSHFFGSGSVPIWTAKGLQNQAQIILEVREHLERARERKADVVIFPELTFPPDVIQATSDWLNAQPGNDDDGESCIQWVVAGSFHCPAGATVVNQSLLLDRFGNVVTMGAFNPAIEWAQEKLTSVSLRVVNEGNEPSETILLAHTPLGMQAVVICLDLAQGATLDKVGLELLPLRWLWVPSMSEKVNAHYLHVRELAINRRITVVCANQGQAKFSEKISLNGTMLQSFVAEPLDPGAGTFGADGPNWSFRCVKAS
jgi:predicted amidohydrolase